MTEKLCGACNGSGEGSQERDICLVCEGLGTEQEKPELEWEHEDD